MLLLQQKIAYLCESHEVANAFQCVALTSPFQHFALSYIQFALDQIWSIFNAYNRAKKHYMLALLDVTVIVISCYYHSPRGVPMNEIPHTQRSPRNERLIL